MLNVITINELACEDVLETETISMIFVEEADYEFVGGGNAVNSY